MYQANSKMAKLLPSEGLRSALLFCGQNPFGFCFPDHSTVWLIRRDGHNSHTPVVLQMCEILIMTYYNGCGEHVDEIYLRRLSDRRISQISFNTLMRLILPRSKKAGRHFRRLGARRCAARSI